MDFKEAVAAIVAGVALLVPAVKWLINDWAKKAKELEERKEHYSEKNLNRLNDEVREFRGAIASLQTTISQLETSMAVSKSEMEYLKEQLKSTVKRIDEYTRDFDSKIANRIKTEIIELSKRAQLVREKKNGQS